jgi:hypothetical protein
MKTLSTEEQIIYDEIMDEYYKETTEILINEIEMLQN